MAFVYVMLGGAFGAAARHGLQLSLNAVFPWGTFTANALGSFLIGVAFAYLPNLSDPSRAVIITGFLGAFTTMSSYSLEVVQLVEAKRYSAALAHWAGGAVLCVLLCAAGVWLANTLRAS